MSVRKDEREEQSTADLRRNSGGSFTMRSIAFIVSLLAS